jgi:dihydrofolate reductase/thymidylate synthase
MLDCLGLTLIYARNNNNIIGATQKFKSFIPWDAPNDLNFFNRITTYVDFCIGNKYNYLIVGRKTWDEMLLFFTSKKCPYRKVVILSRNIKLTYDVNFNLRVESNIIDAIKFINNAGDCNNIFVIGGAEIYDNAINTGLVTKIYDCLIDINLDFESQDITYKYLPESVTRKINQMNLINRSETEILVNNCMTKYTISKYESIPFELQYLNLLKQVMSNGIIRLGRNGNTKSINDVSIKINLQDGFPIVTVKRTFWKGIVEELLWMMRGHTNTKLLSNIGIKIWDGNSSKQYLESVGLNYEEGDIGPGYGFQMRHFGADYQNLTGVDLNVNVGQDQLLQCVHLLKTNPNNRRIIICLWNPSDTNKMALPPCHLLYQFTVTSGKLNCHLYQRSWDILLGWNTSTAALLTHIMAHFTGYDIGTLTHTICDVHIYETHLSHIDEIFNRIPYKLSQLKINCSVPKEITDYKFEDFTLENYLYHPVLKLNMVA